MPARKYRFVVASVLSACLISFPAVAQEKRQIAPGFPSKPVRVIVAVAAGGGMDMVTRTVAARVAERLPFPVFVENIPGANGVIAVNTVISAPPDGHTILSTSGSLPVNAVFKKFQADVRSALMPVAQMSFQPYMVFVPAASPFRTFQDLIAHAKKNPGKLNYGSSGYGSPIHMGMELIKYGAGVDMAHITYKGNAPAQVDLIAGRLDVLLSSISGLRMVRTGKAKVIAITAAQRHADYPDVPTVAESGIPGYEMINAYSLYVPAMTPAAIVNALNREVIQVLSDAELRKKMIADASTPAPPRSPQELQKLLVSEIERWDAVVKKANIKLQN